MRAVSEIGLNMHSTQTGLKSGAILKLMVRKLIVGFEVRDQLLIRLNRLIEVRTDEQLSENVLYGKYSKTGDALTLLFFIVCLRYAIRKVQENKMGLKMNRKTQLFAYAYVVSLLRVDANIVKKKRRNSKWH
jgi:hypothetical protein